MTPTPTPPGGGEELRKRFEAEYDPPSNWRTNVYWLDRYFVRLEEIIVSAESKHAEEITEKESDRWGKRLDWIHRLYGVDGSGVDSGDTLDVIESEIRQAFTYLEEQLEMSRHRLSSLESRHAEEMREAIGFTSHECAEAEAQGWDWPTDEFLVSAFLATRQSHSGTENVPPGDQTNKGESK